MVERAPARAESRARLLDAVRGGEASAGEVIAAIESDVALLIAVLRLANRREALTSRGISSVQAALEVLSREEVQRLGEQLPVFDPFQRAPAEETIPASFRVHAFATYRAAERLAEETGHEDRDELMSAALLHDVGKLVLLEARADYRRLTDEASQTPETRIAIERRELGVDHARVGGALVRRWGLPSRFASMVEGHHRPVEGKATLLVRLADTLAHHSQGHLVDIDQLVALSRRLRISRSALGSIVYELSAPIASVHRPGRACPLSARQLEVLRGLADGKLYRQIAEELGLSTHTVRNHAHAAYRKLGVTDRAQAVLLAAERGWI